MPSACEKGLFRIIANGVDEGTHTHTDQPTRGAGTREKYRRPASEALQPARRSQAHGYPQAKTHQRGALEHMGQSQSGRTTPLPPKDPAGSGGTWSSCCAVMSAEDPAAFDLGWSDPALWPLPLSPPRVRLEGSRCQGPEPPQCTQLSSRQRTPAPQWGPYPEGKATGGSRLAGSLTQALSPTSWVKRVLSLGLCGPQFSDLVNG